MGKTVRGNSCGTWMGKSTELRVSVCSSKARIVLIGVCVDDIKMTGKKQNMTSMWKKLMRNVDLDEPTSFLDHVYLGWTRRECKPNEIIYEQYTEMFESRMSAGAFEKLSGWEKPHAKTVAWSWSYDMEGHAQKSVERYCELVNKQSNYTKFQVLVWMIVVCSPIVLKCWYLARIGRPDILRSENKLARSVTKWTQACDGRIGKIDFVHSSHK